MTGRGRRTLYKPENGELARMFCLLGATNEDLAGLSDVVLRTIDNWIATHASLLCTHQADDQRFGHQGFSGRAATAGNSQIASGNCGNCRNRLVGQLREPIVSQGPRRAQPADLARAVAHPGQHLCPMLAVPEAAALASNEIFP